MRNDSQKIGDLAEQYFNIWCTEGDITINDSKRQDETGWDFFVEFKRDISKIIDIYNPTIECKIQVKSTKTKGRSTSVQLEHVLHISNSIIPSFYALIVFDDKFKPSSLYLRYFDDSLVERTFKRINKLLSDNKLNDGVKRLHEDTLSISFRDKDKIGDFIASPLENFDVNQISEKILSTIGKNFSEYAQNRKKYIEELKSKYTPQFININKFDIVKFTYLLLGVGEEIDVQEITFEQPLDTSCENIPKAKLSVSKPKANKQGHIYVFNEVQIPINISFKVNLYVLDINDLLPDEFKLCRLETTYFDIMVNPITLHSVFLPNFLQEKLQLNEFIKFARFFNAIATSTYPLIISVNIDKIKLTSQIKLENKPRVIFDLNVLESLLSIVTYFNLDHSVVSYEKVLQMKPEISMFNDLLSNKVRSIEMKRISTTVNINDNCCLLISKTLNLKDYKLVIISLLKSTVCQIKNEIVTFNVNEAMNIDSMISYTDTPLGNISYKNRIDELVAKLQGEHFIVDQSSFPFFISLGE